MTMAPFETFPEFNAREKSGIPYSDEYLEKCRKKALEYSKEDVFLRGILLSDLQRAIPLHARAKVFDGISFVYVQ